MAKLTLNDISGGYQSASQFNANFALIEAAMENTLSRDGTTPNTMGTDLDMNGFDLNNVTELNMTGVGTISGVGALSATSLAVTSLSLNGEAITPTTVLTGGLNASEVTYDSGALDAKLDSDFLKTTGNYAMAGTLTVNGALSAAAGLDVTGNITVSGTVDGVDIAARDADLTAAESSVSTLEAINHIRIAARIYKNTNQVLADSSFDAIEWDVAQYEAIDVWDVSTPTRITVPAGYTKIRVETFVMFETAADYTLTFTNVYKNGSSPIIGEVMNNVGSATLWPGSGTGTVAPRHTFSSGWMECSEGDYYEIMAYHTNGTSDTRYVFGASTGACWVSVELAP